MTYNEENVRSNFYTTVILYILPAGSLTWRTIPVYVNLTRPHPGAEAQKYLLKCRTFTRRFVLVVSNSIKASRPSCLKPTLVSLDAATKVLNPTNAFFPSTAFIFFNK
jgi:hypothetical protein